MNVCPPHCPCRQRGCACGNLGLLGTLPLEIVEAILDYQDPLSLLVVERSSRYLAMLVAGAWVRYCRRRNLLGCNPTPLCVGWKTNRRSQFSFECALQASQSLDQKWRLVAVRFYLNLVDVCVGCQSEKGQFRLKDDIILCYCCSKVFCLHITKEVAGILSRYGVNTDALTRSCSPVLLSEVISLIRAAGHSEKECLHRLRPYLGIGNQVVCSLDNLHSPRIPDVGGVFFIAQRGCMINEACACLKQNTSGGSRCCQSERKALALGFRDGHDCKRMLGGGMLAACVVFTAIHLLMTGIVLSKHRYFDVRRRGLSPFLQVACVNTVTVGASLSMLVFWLGKLCGVARFRSNMGSCRVFLQCMLVTSLITQVTEGMMAASVLANLEVSYRRDTLALYVAARNDTSASDTLHHLSKELTCCVLPSIRTNFSTSTGNGYNATGNQELYFIEGLACVLYRAVDQKECWMALRSEVTVPLSAFVAIVTIATVNHVALLACTGKLWNMVSKRAPKSSGS